MSITLRVCENIRSCFESLGHSDDSLVENPGLVGYASNTLEAHHA